MKFTLQRVETDCHRCRGEEPGRSTGGSTKHGAVEWRWRRGEHRSVGALEKKTGFRYGNLRTSRTRVLWDPFSTCWPWEVVYWLVVYDPIRIGFFLGALPIGIAHLTSPRARGVSGEDESSTTAVILANTSRSLAAALSRLCKNGGQQWQRNGWLWCVYVLNHCVLMPLCVVCSRADHNCILSTCSTSAGASFHWRSTCCFAWSSCSTSSTGTLFPSVSYSLVLLASHPSPLPCLISLGYYSTSFVYMVWYICIYPSTQCLSWWVCTIFCINFMSLLGKAVHVPMSSDFWQWQFDILTCSNTSRWKKKIHQWISKKEMVHLFFNRSRSMQ